MLPFRSFLVSIIAIDIALADPLRESSWDLIGIGVEIDVVLATHVAVVVVVVFMVVCVC